MIIGAILIILLILIDQATKTIAAANIALNSPNIVVIPRLLELSFHKNEGMSFGLLAGEQLLFMVATVIALGIFGYFFLDSNFKTKKVYSIAIALFIGGTLGNAIDRALYGYVIDFMQFPFFGPLLGLFGTGNFYNNFADIFLSFAIVLFGIDLFFLEPKRAKKEKLNVENND
ncbi:MAG: signal peptidase II [Acholeplasmataceae bacterium]|nr:signal peptidase II [Acholeplasmataceae bacterium]